MKKIIKIVLAVAVLGLFASTLFSGHSQADNTSNSLDIVARAEQLAGFKSDEIVPKPQISYLMPGDPGQTSSLFSKDKKIVNFFSPGEYLPTIQVVFLSPTFEITDGKNKITCGNFKNTVAGVITDCGIELADEDMTSPPRDSQPVSNQIKITRVNIAQIEKTQTIDFATDEVDDNTLERGKTTVEDAGKVGTRKLTYQVRREDGVEVSRVLIKDEVTQKPENRVIKIGTKVVVLSSVKGLATIYKPSNCSVVSANYKKGTTVRITNLANGASTIKTVDCTWGTAMANDGNVMDLSLGVLGEIKYNGSGAGPNVLVEQLKN
jgi:hypothetical protein